MSEYRLHRLAAVSLAALQEELAAFQERVGRPASEVVVNPLDLPALVGVGLRVSLPERGRVLPREVWVR